MIYKFMFVAELQEYKRFYYDSRFSIYDIEKSCKTTVFLQVLEPW